MAPLHSVREVTAASPALWRASAQYTPMVARLSATAPDGLPSENPACSLDLPQCFLHLLSQMWPTVSGSASSVPYCG
eukprot:6869707-Pyramimonas_sp.AAC.1